ncbi:MAG: putative S-layer protein [Nanoarchaeota archaeon]
MKSRLFSIIFASLILLLAVVSVSATITASQTSFSNSTNPSDDSTTRTISFDFTLASSDVADANVIIRTSGFSSWNPVLSKTSDIIVPSGTNSYSLQLTVPKYSTNPTSGTIFVNYSSGVPIASIPVSVAVNSFASLKFLKSPVILNKSSNNASVTIKNDGNQPITNIVVSIENNAVRDSDDEELSLSFTPTESFNLNPQETKIINVTYSQDPEDIDLLLGSASTTIRAASTLFSTSTVLTFNQDFCESGEIGNDVEIVSVQDETSSNGNFDWDLLEEIELEIEARNNDNDEQDVTVAITLYDPENGDNLFEDEQTISINDDDEETFLFNFTLPADTPDNARLYVKAYFDGDQDEQCDNRWDSRAFESISINDRDDYEVGITDLEIESPLMCGSSASLEAQVHNIGDKDQKRVLVSVTNDELGIDQEVLLSNLDAGESKRVIFNIDIPQDADEKLFQLGIEARHEYNSRNDNYESVNDRVLRSFRVEGNCVDDGSSSDGLLTISPTLESEAVAGKELVIRASIRNVNSDAGTFSIIPFSYESWAVLDGVEPSSVVLAKGESRDVTITLTPKSGTSGEQKFTIRASKGSVITDQEAVVFIKGSSAPSGSAIIDSIKENWVIWVIVLANIILIAAIIIAAVRLSRRE